VAKGSLRMKVYEIVMIVRDLPYPHAFHLTHICVRFDSIRVCGCEYLWVCFYCCHSLSLFSFFLVLRSLRRSESRILVACKNMWCLERRFSQRKSKVAKLLCLLHTLAHTAKYLGVYLHIHSHSGSDDPHFGTKSWKCTYKATQHIRRTTFWGKLSNGTEQENKNMSAV